MSFMWLLIYYVLVILLIMSYKLNDSGSLENKSEPMIYVDNVVMVLVVLSFSILCATRDINGYDSKLYINYFTKLKDIDFISIEGSYRIGFEYVSKILVWVTNNNYKWIFGIMAAINCVIVYFATKKNIITKVYGYIVYLSFLGLYYSFIVLRQGFAIGLVILAYSYFKESKVKFIICAILAVLFHESALIVLVAYLIFSKELRINKQLCYCLLTTFLILYNTKVTNLLIQPFFSAIHGIFPYVVFYKYVLYYKDVVLTNDVSLFHLFCYGLTFWLIYKSRERKSVYNTLLVYNLIGLGLLSLFSGTTAIIRLTDYLTASTYVFLVPEAFETEKYKEELIVLIALAMIFFYVRIIVSYVPFY